MISCVHPQTEALHEVAPPPLGDLGPSSQGQYRDLRQDLAAADREGKPAARALAWGRLAQWHDVHRFFGTAQLAYDNAHILAPEEPRWPYHMGRLALREGDLMEAEVLWRRVLELEPGHLATTVRLAEVLFAQAHDEEAEALFRQALARQPSCARARAGLADIALRRGDLAGAAAELERALTGQPQATSLHYRLGIVYRQQGRRAEAAEQLALLPTNAIEQTVVDLDDPWLQELQGLKKTVTFHVQAGMRAYRQGLWAVAETEFRLALAEDPSSLRAWQNLADTLLKQGRLDEAIAAARAALEAVPGSSTGHNMLGTLLARRGRTDEAEFHLRAALETDRDDKRAHYNLGQILLQSERFEEALPHFDRAIELDPQLGQARHQRAVVLWLLDRQREAIETLTVDLATLPGNRELAALMARFLSTAAEDDLRQGSRALAWLPPVGSSGETVSLAETRAMVLAEISRYREAAAWQRAAVATLKRAGRQRALARSQQRLDLYGAERPCRRGWEPDEALLALPVAVPDSVR